MKKLLIPFVALFVIAISLTSWRSNSAKEAATVINDFGCQLYDGDGNLVLADASQVVITSSGNTNFKCSASGVANSTGKAVVYKDFLCFAYTDFTSDTHETVSANGNATLQCKIHE